MPPIDFIPKLDDSTGRRSRPALNLWPLVISAIGLFALSWLLRRFAPTPQTIMTWVGLLALAALLFVLVQHNNVFAGPLKSRLQPKHAEAITLSFAETQPEAEVAAIRQFSTHSNGSIKSDDAWAEAVAAYEYAMQRLAAGKPGSRIEAQTSALELARLQSLLVQASRPHLPLGL